MQFPPIGGQISRSDRPNRRSCSAIPPLGGVGAAVWSVVVAKVQTHEVTSTQKRRFWLNGYALWRIYRLAWLVAPTDFRPPRGLFCWAGPLYVPVGGGPPARSPHASLAARSGRSRSPARPRRHPPAPRPGPAGPAAASNRAVLTVCALSARPRRRPPAPRPGPPPSRSTRVQPSHPSFLYRHPISHAIPPRLFQTLNSDRWNCNVSRLC